MSDLVAFLAARLDEDEAQIRWYAAQSEHEGPQLIATVPGFGDLPARVLREVEAKRARLRRYTDSARNASERRADGHPSPAVETIRDALHGEALHDAAIYSDHPDYQAEWKP